MTVVLTHLFKLLSFFINIHYTASVVMANLFFWPEYTFNAADNFISEPECASV